MWLLNNTAPLPGLTATQLVALSLFLPRSVTSEPSWKGPCVICMAVAASALYHYQL